MTNGPCQTKTNRTCIKKVTVLHREHQIVVLNDEIEKNFQIFVDADQLNLENMQEVSDWMKIKKSSDLLNLVFPSDQLEVEFDNTYN